MKLLHFDKERYLGIIEKDNKQYIAVYPFLRMKPLNKEFKFEVPTKNYKSEDQILRKIKMEFHLSSLVNVHQLLSKTKSNSFTNLTNEAVRSNKIKTTLRELSQGRIYKLDIKEIEVLKIAMGISPTKVKEIENLIGLIDPDAKKEFSKKMIIESSGWKKDIDELIEFIEKEIIPEERFKEANEALLFIMASPGLEKSDLMNNKLNKLMDDTKEGLEKKAIENGENFKKPWEKHMNPTLRPRNKKRRRK